MSADNSTKPIRLCSFPGCGRKHEGHGLCQGHRQQQKRGEELAPLFLHVRPKNTPPRILYDEVPCPVAGLKGPCHVFRGNISKGSDGGYGTVGFKGKIVKVHRYVYERDVGPIPEGMKIDHRCRVRACCNPDHLRCVTNQVNTTENVVNHQWQVMAARTHCKNGHEFTPENVPLKTSKGRGCRACNREKRRRFQERQRVKRPLVARTPRTHCKRGHLLDETNTYITKLGYRDCRECGLIKQRAYQARLKAKRSQLPLTVH